MDMINKLPDSLLCHILSFLPLEVVVSTSILSKRWQHLWSSVPNLDIDASKICGNNMRFEHIMFRILLLRNMWSIRKFRLHCGYDFNCDPIHLRTMICATVAHNVEELHLEMRIKEDFELPRSLLLSKTLVVLKLCGRISIKFDSWQLPSLRDLHLYQVCFQNKDSSTIGNVIFDCPVLESLLIHIYWSSCKLNVNAPALKYLTIHDTSCTDIAFTDLNNLVKATVYPGPMHTKLHRDAVFNVVQVLYNVKFLEVNFLKFGAICDHRGIDSFHKFPEFHNLVELKLYNFCSFWDVIQHLLQKCPLLEHFSFMKDYMCFQNSEEPQSWIPPQQVPNCMSFHLRTVNFRWFNGLEADMQLARYILKNSKALRNMTISFVHGSDLNNKSSVLKKVSLFERGSSRCQLKFE